MAEGDLVELVRRSLADSTRREFDRRVDEQAALLVSEIEAGRFDNESFTVGLELEGYGVDDDGRLARLPDRLFDDPACNEELGLHNVELNTDPDPFDPDGIAAQAAGIRERVDAARSAFGAVGLDLVLDAMWTIPPPEGSVEYLSAVEVREGVTVAANMRQSPRYCAIDNDVLERSGGAVHLDLPGVRRSFPSILVESLTTSIQPHLQVPFPEAFPDHYNAGIRTLGPVLALATNSPFLPADLYDPEDPYALVDETYHELRVPVFEQAINADARGTDRKVRLPEDIERTTDIVDRLVADRTCAPFLREWLDGGRGFVDHIPELDHKRGTYWRWLRSVIGGQPVAGTSERSVRIEYRPVPTQPSVDDVVGFQCLVSGLVRGLVAADHPLCDLDWAAAERSFYGAVERGLDADLAWITAEGERTSDHAAIYEEVFAFARRGLREQGLAAADIDRYLAPVEARWRVRATPSRWKKARVRERLDRGASLREAIVEMQREYIDRSRSGEPFADWL